MLDSCWQHLSEVEEWHGQADVGQGSEAAGYYSKQA